MKKQIIIASLFIIGFIAIVAQPVFAHQPRIIESETIEVIDAEVPKAFYGEITGTPHLYTIESSKPFELYVGILMPYSENSKKDVQAEIRKGDKVLDVIGGKNANWKKLGYMDRLFRLTIAISLGLLILAITTSWNPWLLFFSGFTIFEAIFSWCGFYAAIDKNTYPL